MPSYTLTPVGGDPFGQGAHDLDPVTAPPLTIHAATPIEAGALTADPTDYTPQAPLPQAAATAAQIGAVGSSLASGHAAEDYRRLVDPDGTRGNAVSGFSLPAMVASGADAITNYGRYARDVQSGAYGDAPWRSQAAIDRGMPAAADLAATMGLGGMAGAQEGAAGIFGGRLSATADRGAMARAGRALDRGADPEQIYRDTGYFRGVDGQMREEISDHMARLTGNALEPSGDNWPISNVLDHPALFRAYPDLASTRFSNVPMPGEEKFMGAFTGSGVPGQPGRLFVNPKYGPDEGLKTALHEMQHAVQEREGFNPGASPDGLAATLPSAAVLGDVKLMSALLQTGVAPSDAAAVFAQRLGRDPHPVALPMAQQIDPLDAAKLPLGPNDAYRRNMGEVEARNVEARRTMDWSDRLQAPPWATQSVPNEMQLVGTGGVGGASVPFQASGVPGLPAPQGTGQADPAVLARLLRQGT